MGRGQPWSRLRKEETGMRAEDRRRSSKEARRRTSLSRMLWPPSSFLPRCDEARKLRDGRATFLRSALYAGVGFCTLPRLPDEKRLRVGRDGEILRKECSGGERPLIEEPRGEVVDI